MIIRRSPPDVWRSFWSEPRSEERAYSHRVCKRRATLAPPKSARPFRHYVFGGRQRCSGVGEAHRRDIPSFLLGYNA